VGKYDDLLADLPTGGTGGRFDDLLSDLGPPPQTTWGAVKAALGSRQELQPYGPYAERGNPITLPNAPSGPISGALDMARQTLEAPIRTGATIGNVPEVAGQSISNIGETAGYPKTGAAIGTAVSLAPLAYGLAQGGKAIDSFLRGPNMPSFVRGITNTPKMLGPEYEAQNRLLGVDRATPLEGGRYPTFAKPEMQFPTKQPKPLVPPEPLPGEVPIRYPSAPGDFLSYAKGRLAGSPDQIDPQELMDWQVKLQTDMNNGKIPQFDKNGNPTTIFADASDVADQSRRLFKQFADTNLPMLQEEGAVPSGVSTSRSSLDAANRYAHLVRNPIASVLPAPVIYALKKYGPSILEGLGVGAGIGVAKR
jgi:hypothetical protein